MKRALKFMAIGATGLMLTSAVGAVVHARSGDDHRRHGGGKLMFETFDANGDGSVNQAEVDQVRADRLVQFDANGDGSVDLTEYEALWLDAMRERMVDRFQHLDSDGSGLVTLEEFAAPFANTVARLDRNGDGNVTADEVRKRRKGHHRDRDRDGDREDN